MEKKRTYTKDEAVDLAKSFLLGGLRIRADDSAETVTRIQRIIDSEKKSISKAVKAFMSNSDVDAFLLSLCPLHTRIFYEGYGDYWLKHCRLVDPAVEHDNDASFTHYNDLIDMFWVGEWQEWKTKGKWEVTIMLPPTAGLMRASYREKMKCICT